jgi:hypothetical protein
MPSSSTSASREPDVESSLVERAPLLCMLAKNRVRIFRKTPFSATWHQIGANFIYNKQNMLTCKETINGCQ